MTRLIFTSARGRATNVIDADQPTKDHDACYIPDEALCTIYNAESRSTKESQTRTSQGLAPQIPRSVVLLQ